MIQLYGTIREGHASSLCLTAVATKLESLTMEYLR
jgi:hypothetical protein